MTRCAATRCAALLVMLLTLVAVPATTAFAVTIAVDSRAAYLRHNTTNPFNDPAQPAVIIDLATIGFAAGDTIHIDQLGDFQFNSSNPDTSTNMGGVFSSTNVLLSSASVTNANPSRVPGAIAAGTPFVSGPTFSQGLPTDIPQDFRIDPEVVITIPAGALYLFIGSIDSFYSDNLDPDRDFAVSITGAVPEPATALLLLTGVAGVIAWRRARNT